MKRPASSQKHPAKAKSGNTAVISMLSKHPKFLLLTLPMLLAGLFAFLLFDVKISEGNDDSMYIEAAWNYAQDFTGYFYRANAPLYPMALGIITMITGLNLIVYKIINTLLFLVFIYFTYRAFSGRIPDVILFPVMILTAINSQLIFFASQTYTEIPYLALQAVFIWIFLSGYEKQKQNPGKANILNGSVIKFALSVAFFLFLLTMTRNIAIGVVAGVLIFLLIERDFKLAAVTAGMYAGLRILWTFTLNTVWGKGDQYSSQWQILRMKNPYNAAEGVEEWSGFPVRFISNLDLYTSKRLLQIFGFRGETATDTWPLFSLLIAAFILWCVWKIFRIQPGEKDTISNATETIISASAKRALMLGALTFIMPFGLTLIVLQTHWETVRLIVVYLPFIAMILFFGFYFLWHQGNKKRSWLFIVPVGLILTVSTFATLKKTVNHFPVLVKNLNGDKYYGYTPDWENYLKLSEWCADHLPPDAVIAARKAPMSFVYGKGRTFFPVYSAVAINPNSNLSDPDSVLAYFKQHQVTHAIAASIRTNPYVNDGIIINTIQRMLIPIAQKYPGKLKLIKQIGDEEAAHLYEIIP